MELLLPGLLKPVQKGKDNHHRSNKRFFHPSFDVCDKKKKGRFSAHSESEEERSYVALKASGPCCSDTFAAITTDGSRGVALSINSSSSLNRRLLSPARLLNRRTH